MNELFNGQRRTPGLGMAIVATILAGSAGGAYAQSDSDSPRASTAMEEITVTARKREETLQEAPVAISVLTGDNIRDAGIANMNDLTSRLPNVGGIDEPAGLDGNGFAPTIRGLGTGSRQIGEESGLGVFIDGAYAGNNDNGNKFLPPVERVEFLPGPQATLFGKNTTVGVMNIITKKPGDELEIYAHAGAGNNGHVEYGGSIYAPLNDNWGIGLTLGMQEYEGYLSNANPPLEPAPTDDCFNIFVPEPWPPMGCLGNAWAGLYDGITGPKMDAWGGTFQLAYRGDTVTFDLLVDYNDAERTNRPPAQRIEGFDALPRDTFSTSTPGTAVGDETGVTATITKTFANDSELTSITNYREFFTDEDYDDDAYFYRVVEVQRWITEQDQVSQELRYSGKAGNASYLIGAYWQDQELFTSRDGDILEITPNLEIEGLLQNETTAVFGNVDFDLGDVWGAELGIRRSSETKDMPYFYNDTSEAGFWQGTISDSLKSDRTSYTGALSFAATDDLNAHLRYSRGYKSGGFAIEYVVYDFEPTEDLYKFKDEQADSFELGMKWQATDELWINAALFYTDISDLQVSQYVQVPDQPVPFIIIGNAGKARTQGIEVTAIYQGEQLGLNASVGYNNAEYVEWMRPTGIDPETGEQTFEDMAGRELATPRQTANLLASYQFNLGGRTLDLIGEYQYRGKSPAAPGADSSLFADKRSQINARIRYQINDNLDVTLWAKNLMDKRSVLGRGRNGQRGFIRDGGYWYLPGEIAEGINDQVTGDRQAPRHWGLTFNYRY